ncbi:TATA-box binding protein [Fontibacillus phaseoli]|uniref:TATA-box binding protein n=1 Tax=Fontibacillus phaseoli TaxID=1416533 RepID=A0A369BED4_9BACL|nr:YwmB family TATA-box binding protein [Fontibacillus phaseoli]RCX19585.1 TATA-box binding protein [Fontibacillus phaseoli]
MKNPGSKTKVRSGAMMMAGGLLLLALLLGNIAKGQAVAVTTGDSVEAAAVQWDKLFAVGTGAIQEEIQGTVKWQGSWYTLLALEEAANALSSRLGLSVVHGELMQDHTVYYAEGNARGIHTRLSVTWIEEGEYYVVLRLEGQGLEALAEMKASQSAYGESLADEGVAIHWNAALQGTVKSMDTGSAELSDGKGNANELLQDRMQQLENVASHALNLEIVEDYKDTDTISRTYAIPELPISVFSGDRKVSLQMAVHSGFESGNMEVSLGSPLLTVEY